HLPVQGCACSCGTYADPPHDRRSFELGPALGKAVGVAPKACRGRQTARAGASSVVRDDDLFRYETVRLLLAIRGMRFANSPSVMSKVTVPATMGRNSASLSQVYGRVAARVSVRNARGMTLVEVMIVVVIVGILSALGIYGVQKYLRSAQASEAYA